MKKNILTIIILVIVLALLGYVGFGYYKTLTSEKKNPIVTMEIENYGTIKMELYPDVAPNTVKNFINLIQKGYYDGKVFSGLDSTCVYIGKNSEGNVENAKMSLVNDSIEAGSDADVEYSIEGEFVANGYDNNNLKHEKGTISMSRIDYTQFSSSLTKESYNSANAQFCILLNDERGLNGMYAAFGKVIEGLDILDQIANVEVITRDDNAKSGIDVPVNPPVITQIRVETYGVDYKTPDTVEPFNYYNWLIKKYQSNLSTEQ